MPARAAAVCALLLSAALLAAGCGGGGKHGSGAPQQGAGRLSAPAVKGLPPPRQFLSVDAHAHAVTVTLIAAFDGANAGMNFDGYSRLLMWTVPLGWKVHVVCKNRGPLRHSCAVVDGAGTTTPAFRGAETPQPQIGIEAGTTARFTFRAAKVGVYRFTCLVPGHEAARMWDVLKVVRRGKPSVVSLLAG